jgi:hypothetical protein
MDPYTLYPIQGKGKTRETELFRGKVSPDAPAWRAFGLAKTLSIVDCRLSIV